MFFWRRVQDQMKEEWSKLMCRALSMKRKVAEPFFNCRRIFWDQGRIVLWVAFLDGVQIALYSNHCHTVHVHVQKNCPMLNTSKLIENPGCCHVVDHLRKATLWHRQMLSSRQCFNVWQRCRQRQQLNLVDISVNQQMWILAPAQPIYLGSTKSCLRP